VGVDIGGLRNPGVDASETCTSLADLISTQPGEGEHHAGNLKTRLTKMKLAAAAAAGVQQIRDISAVIIGCLQSETWLLRTSPTAFYSTAFCCFIRHARHFYYKTHTLIVR